METKPNKSKQELKVAGWNVRTMLDKAASSRPERRSALIAHELSRLNIDIAAISEVRFADESSLKERGAGYTLFWSGKPSSKKRVSGVGLMENSAPGKCSTGDVIISHDKQLIPAGSHERTYNPPTASEVAVIMVGDDTNNPNIKPVDVVVQYRESNGS
ncbi:Hypothetical predicted protein [Octopus vulgaris]|uniref:Uncharacterized protein n=1 Tax=Octopus vulgaris TaxID=6645 RepID=A0AA36BJL1_OCTVU|nr:Hypothetical predicted protein [Octopus vulgaris]